MNRFSRAVRDITLLLLRPQRFIQLATDDDIARDFPNGQVTPQQRNEAVARVRDRTHRIRRGLGLGFASVLLAVGLAWLSGFAALYLLGAAPSWLSNVLQVSAAAILLGATLSVLGWEIQSFRGDTRPEQVNRLIFRTLYVIGTYLLLLSIFWPANLGSPDAGAASTGIWINGFVGSNQFWNLLITLTGTFAGVSLAFLIDRQQREARARRQYANTLNSIRADVANLSALCKQVSNRLVQDKGFQPAVPLELPVLDATLTNPTFYDRVPYGLVTGLILLSNVRRSTQNGILRKLPATSESDVAAIREALNELSLMAEYLGRVVDDEVKPLGQPVVRTPRDVRVIDGLKKVLRGQDGQAPSDPQSTTESKHES